MGLALDPNHRVNSTKHNIWTPTTKLKYVTLKMAGGVEGNLGNLMEGNWP